MASQLTISMNAVRDTYACAAKACGAHGLTLDETWACADCPAIVCDEHILSVGNAQVCGPCAVRRATKGVETTVFDGQHHEDRAYAAA